jgi:hypothetical protein
MAAAAFTLGFDAGRRTGVVDLEKKEIDTIAFRRWLVDFEIALQRRLDAADARVVTNMSRAMVKHDLGRNSPCP